MTGARLVDDTLEQGGWDVEIADAQKVKGLAPLACKTDKIDSQMLAVLSHRELVPAIWLPDPRVREERELARFRLQLVWRTSRWSAMWSGAVSLETKSSCPRRSRARHSSSDTAPAHHQQRHVVRAGAGCNGPRPAR
jgi:hypothetical protein